MVVIKIFNATDTNFNTAGNIIIEPLYCKEIKKKSLNGWYIDVEVPVKYKQYIEQDKLCVVKTKSKLNPQAFRIKDIEYTLNKVIFKAYHVMFDAEDYFLLDVRPTNMNGLNTLNYINDRTDKISPFFMLSNVENVDTAYFIRKSLLAAWTIIEERWNGVFDADNWNISFLTSVGSDKGETIRYGKNLQEMKVSEDWSGVCTKIYPVGQDELMLPEKFLESDIQYDEPYTRTIKFDTKLDEEDQTTENLLLELRTNAANYLSENSVPKVCYEINSNINQDMEIGDIIAVKHPLCDITTEVLEYEYDLLTKKVIKLVFGNYTKNVKKRFEAISETFNQIKETISKQNLTIKNQTDIINSLNKNGYVYIDDNEILILDTLPKENAENVWRFGLGGIGFSSNGYEGPFEVAMTMDGQINANFITTGTLSVSRIEGLANFISDTSSQLAEIEVNQENITQRVSNTETKVENITITEATKEGNPIIIDDSAEEPIVRLELDGNSTQETRSGKNKFDRAKVNVNGNTITLNDTGVTISQNWANTLMTNANVLKDFKPNTNYICTAKVTLTELPENIYETSNTYSILILYKQGGTTKEILRLATKTEKDNWQLNEVKELQTSFTTPNDLTDYRILSYNYYGGPSILGTGTFKIEELMIREATETDDTFELYGASPSPDYPSEIRSVADDVNLFDASKISNTNIVVNDNGKTIIMPLFTSGVGYTSTSTKLSNLCPDLKVGDIAFLHFIKNISGSYNNYIYLAGANKTWIKDTYVTITQSDLDSTVIMYANDYNHGETEQLIITDFKIQKGTTATPYSEYGKGTVTIKQREKNLFDKNAVTQGKWLNINGELETAQNYVVSDFIELTEGETYYIPARQTTRTKYYKSDKSVYSNIWDVSDTAQTITIPSGVKYIRMSILVQGTSAVNLDTFQFEKDTLTPYEPYQGYDKVLQTEPLHSLPNGVKDTIEAEHHRKIGRQTGTLTETTTITLSDAKTNGAYMCNIKPSGTLTGKTIELEAGDYEIIYELAEEIIEPFIEEQKEVLSSIETNLLTQYFSSETNMRITYLKNNGLTDLYETKQNATKKYTETEERFADFEIKNNQIMSKVSEVNTKLQNNYMTTDQINAETGKIKDDIVNINTAQTEITQTARDLQVALTDINDNGVSKVKNTLVKIDFDGVKVSKGTEFESLLSDTGVYFNSYGKQIASYTKDGATMYNLTVENEAILGNLRILSVDVSGEKRTHIHWIGG